MIGETVKNGNRVSMLLLSMDYERWTMNQLRSMLWQRQDLSGIPPQIREIRWMAWMTVTACFVHQLAVDEMGQSMAFVQQEMM